MHPQTLSKSPYPEGPLKPKQQNSEVIRRLCFKFLRGVYEGKIGPAKSKAGGCEKATGEHVLRPPLPQAVTSAVKGGEPGCPGGAERPSLQDPERSEGREGGEGVDGTGRPGEGRRRFGGGTEKKLPELTRVVHVQLQARRGDPEGSF